jgi:hypothetical protein
MSEGLTTTFVSPTFIKMGSYDLINLNHVTRIALITRKGKSDTITFYLSDGNTRSFDIDDSVSFPDFLASMVPLSHSITE